MNNFNFAFVSTLFIPILSSNCCVQLHHVRATISLPSTQTHPLTYTLQKHTFLSPWTVSPSPLLSPLGTVRLDSSRLATPCSWLTLLKVIGKKKVWLQYNYFQHMKKSCNICIQIYYLLKHEKMVYSWSLFPFNW
jgi:hypothetical protein